MRQYMLSVINEPGLPHLSDEEIEQSFKDTGELNEKLEAAGAWVFANGLTPPSSATVVHRDGRVTDGPYLETKEYLGGFWIIEAPDLDAALEWAKQGSVACRQVVEVRPFHTGPPTIEMARDGA
jgi:hypothetical protein